MPTMASCKRPAVTVLMPVYNGARFLNEAIGSIRNQTFADFEFLIIDDGSDDATPGILARHAADDRRIRVVSQENRGLIASLNRGFEEARGELIARMDADDVARPHRLAEEVDFLQSHGNITLVGSAIDVIDAHGRHTQTIRLPETPGEIRRHMRELGCAVAHPTVVFRRKAVLEAGGLRRAYRHAEDYDLWLRMIEEHGFANLPEALLSYRRHEGSVSTTHAIQQILSSFCARLTAKLRLEGVPDPTSSVALITPEIVWSLGVSPQALDAEMFRGLLEMTEMAIDQGRRSAAVEFLSIARPFADAARLRETAIELNRRAAKALAPVEEQSRHRKLLLEADPGIYRMVFGGAIRTSTAGCPGSIPGGLLMRPNTLNEILQRNRYDTDKSEEYLRNYDRAFAHLRNSPIALMEIGVNRGGSLYLWRDYFVSGTIVGVDLYPPADFSDPSGRCHLRRGDQNDPSSLRAIASSMSPAGFNIIIDDASHLGALTALTFKTLFYDHLRPGGFYAIEDWGTGYWGSWPDGGPPAVSSEPDFPNVGKRFPSHDMGVVGFVKQLMDECSLSDIFHPRFGIPQVRQRWIRGLHISPGLVIVEKARE